MYTVEPYPEAEAAIVALPEEAPDGYDDAVKVMRLVPWNGLPYLASKPNGSMRQLLEDQQRVDVLRVVWAGE